MKTLKLLRKSLWSLTSILLTLCICASIGFVYLQAGLPNTESLQDIHMQVPMRIFSKDHKLMGEYGSKRRIPVSLHQVPKQLIQAVLATEDSRYYEHSGVDIPSLFRAAKAVILSGKKVQGASTITMQVARNFFLSHKKTYARKLREIILALKIDHEMSKNKILSLYLNKIFLGHRAYGVAAAAQVYYGKALDQLTLPQMAMLAGLPQAPSTQNPISNPVAAIKRRNHVLERMLETHAIDQPTYEQAIAAPISSSYHQQIIAAPAPYVTELVRRKLFNSFGEHAYEDGLVVQTSIDSRLQHAAKQSLDNGAIAYSKRHGFFKSNISLGIYSDDEKASWQKELAALPNFKNLMPAAIVSQTDTTADALLANGNTVPLTWDSMEWARPYRSSHDYPGPAPKTTTDIFSPGDIIYVSSTTDGHWNLSQLPQVEGALISINPTNGDILSLIGGLSYQQSHFNRTTQAVRQPGSNFKPFIYSAAINKGMTLATMINDAPIVMKDSGENALWRPQNDTLKFYGPTSIRMGLVKSRNVVSVRLLQTTGLGYTLNYIKRFGFNTEQLPHSLSLALGSGGVTPLHLAQGYTMFANGGYAITPHIITSVTNEQGKVIYQPSYPIATENNSNHNQCTQQQCSARTIGLTAANTAKRMITPQNAYLITHALQGVIQQGTGRRARILHRPDLAGKTGTTNKQVDAWFSGYNANIETTVWLGFDDAQRSLHEYASSSALPIWIDYMKSALKGMPINTQAMPSNIITVRIDPHNGLLAPPGDTDSTFEVFRKQNVPTQFASPSSNPENNTPNLAVTPNNLNQNQPIF